MPSHDSGRPDAPTRLAEKVPTGDRFKTLVYYTDESDTFLIIDYHAKPEPYDWVSTGQRSSEDVTLSPYDGQTYTGVARMLEFYPLTQSEQWTPRIRVLVIPLVGIINSILGAFGLS
jgi:hypothetical protein